jgi:hypothetical protein
MPQSSKTVTPGGRQALCTGETVMNALRERFSSLFLMALLDDLGIVFCLFSVKTSA